MNQVVSTSIGGATMDSVSRRSVAVPATLVAVLGAVLFSLSPLTACLAIAGGVVVCWAARDLPAAESR